MALEMISFLKKMFKGKPLKGKTVKWYRMRKALYSVHTDSFFSIPFIIKVKKKPKLLLSIFMPYLEESIEFQDP